MAKAKHRLSDKKRRHDAAYRRAKREQYAGRAIYKLQEIDKRFRLIRHGARVLDLGCWPGSWLQHAAERVGPEGRCIGIDLREVEIALPDTVHTMVGDVFKLKPSALAKRYGPFDVVISDMAPNTTGDRVGDQWGSEELYLRALEIAEQTLRPGGHFVAKVFQGGRFPDLLQRTRAAFQEVKAFRPPSTRAGSFEQYIVGRGLRASVAKAAGEAEDGEETPPEGDSGPSED